ncbi:MAG TPA: hypothetical protein VNA24_35380 [Hyalangium sp.]|nr:hypothetical protein [Hyalangium sp.]
MGRLTGKDAMRHKNTSARRAKKKHQKALKRAQQLTHRRQELARHVVKAAAHLHSPLSRWSPQADGLEGLARQGKMTPFEAASWADELAGRGEHIPKEVWTMSRVQALSAEELIVRLAGLGISTFEDAFREQFSQAWSIWETAERLWLPQLQPQATVHERDFVRVAACVLHGRWMQDTPSHEALLSTFFEGLAALENSEDRRAVERWLSFWRMLRPRLPTRIRHDDLISELQNMREPFFSWALDFATAARNAVREQPELAAPAAEVLGELLSRLAPEDEHWELDLVGDRACLLDAAGRRDEAEQLLRWLREKYPHQSVGYAVQAGLWSHKEANPEQLQRALQLLEEAAARPVLDGQHWELDSRVQQLRRALQESPRSAPIPP